MRHRGRRHYPHGVHMGAEQRRQGGRCPLERNMRGGDAGPLLKQHLGEMAQCRGAGGRHIDVSALAPGKIKELIEIRNPKAGPHHEKLSRRCNEGNRLEAFQGIGIDVRIKARIDRDRIRHHQ